MASTANGGGNRFDHLKVRSSHEAVRFGCPRLDSVEGGQPWLSPLEHGCGRHYILKNIKSNPFADIEDNS